MTPVAIQAMKTMMYESEEIGELVAAQELLDTPQDEEHPLSELTRVYTEFLLNVEEANETVLENVTAHPSIVEEAWELISSKVSTVYSAEEDSFQAMTDVDPQHQIGRHQSDNESVVDSASEP